MDEHLQPNLLNNIEIQPQQDMQKNNTMEIEQQNKQQFDPMNPQMLVGQQGVQQQGKERMERPSMTMQLQQQEAVPTSESLERAADAGFEEGINSRKGSCESRDTKRKKAQARKRLNGQGLTAHSGKLSEQLKAYTADKQEGMQVAVEQVQQYKEMADEEKVENANKIPLMQYNKLEKLAVPLMPFIRKDAQLCKDLMGLNREKCINAYNKLLDKYLEFKLDANSLCTLSAVQRAAETKRQVELGDAMQKFRVYMNGVEPDGIRDYKGPRIDSDKEDLFAAHRQALNSLAAGTEAVVKLQGLNEDGTVLNTFGEKITSAQERSMREVRKTAKKDKQLWTSRYRENFTSYCERLARKKN